MLKLSAVLFLVLVVKWNGKTLVAGGACKYQEEQNKMLTRLRPPSAVLQTMQQITQEECFQKCCTFPNQKCTNAQFLISKQDGSVCTLYSCVPLKHCTFHRPGSKDNLMAITLTVVAEITEYPSSSPDVATTTPPLTTTHKPKKTSHKSGTTKAKEKTKSSKSSHKDKKKSSEKSSTHKSKDTSHENKKSSLKSKSDKDQSDKHKTSGKHKSSKHSKGSSKDKTSKNHKSKVSDKMNETTKPINKISTAATPSLPSAETITPTTKTRDERTTPTTETSIATHPLSSTLPTKSTAHKSHKKNRKTTAKAAEFTTLVPTTARTSPPTTTISSTSSPTTTETTPKPTTGLPHYFTLPFFSPSMKNKAKKTQISVTTSTTPTTALHTTTRQSTSLQKVHPFPTLVPFKEMEKLQKEYMHDEELTTHSTHPPVPKPTSKTTKPTQTIAQTESYIIPTLEPLKELRKLQREYLDSLHTTLPTTTTTEYTTTSPAEAVSHKFKPLEPLKNVENLKEEYMDSLHSTTTSIGTIKPVTPATGSKKHTKGKPEFLPNADSQSTPRISSPYTVSSSSKRHRGKHSSSYVASPEPEEGSETTTNPHPIQLPTAPSNILHMLTSSVTPTPHKSTTFKNKANALNHKSHKQHKPSATPTSPSLISGETNAVTQPTLARYSASKPTETSHHENLKAISNPSHTSSPHLASNENILTNTHLQETHNFDFAPEQYYSTKITPHKANENTDKSQMLLQPRTSATTSPTKTSLYGHYKSHQNGLSTTSTVSHSFAPSSSSPITQLTHSGKTTQQITETSETREENTEATKGSSKSSSSITDLSSNKNSGIKAPEITKNPLSVTTLPSNKTQTQESHTFNILDSILDIEEQKYESLLNSQRSSLAPSQEGSSETESGTHQPLPVTIPQQMVNFTTAQESTIPTKSPSANALLMPRNSTTISTPNKQFPTSSEIGNLSTKQPVKTVRPIHTTLSTPVVMKNSTTESDTLAPTLPSPSNVNDMSPQDLHNLYPLVPLKEVLRLQEEYIRDVLSSSFVIPTLSFYIPSSESVPLLTSNTPNIATTSISTTVSKPTTATPALTLSIEPTITRSVSITNYIPENSVSLNLPHHATATAIRKGHTTTPPISANATNILPTENGTVIPFAGEGEKVIQSLKLPSKLNASLEPEVHNSPYISSNYYPGIETISISPTEYPSVSSQTLRAPQNYTSEAVAHEENKTQHLPLKTFSEMVTPPLHGMAVSNQLTSFSQNAFTPSSGIYSEHLTSINGLHAQLGSTYQSTSQPTVIQGTSGVAPINISHSTAAVLVNGERGPEMLQPSEVLTTQTTAAGAIPNTKNQTVQPTPVKRIHPVTVMLKKVQPSTKPGTNGGQRNGMTQHQIIATQPANNSNTPGNPTQAPNIGNAFLPVSEAPQLANSEHLNSVHLSKPMNFSGRLKAGVHPRVNASHPLPGANMPHISAPQVSHLRGNLTRNPKEEESMASFFGALMAFLMLAVLISMCLFLIYRSAAARKRNLPSEREILMQDRNQPQYRYTK